MKDLENDAVRVQLGAEVIASMDAWGTSRDEQRELLGLSRDEWVRVQKQAPLPLQFEVLERVGHLLALAERYPEDWFRRPVHGEPPVQRMLREGLPAMAALRAEAPDRRENET
jgi:hypothetical protein